MKVCKGTKSIYRNVKMHIELALENVNCDERHYFYAGKYYGVFMGEILKGVNGVEINHLAINSEYEDVPF